MLREISIDDINSISVARCIYETSFPRCERRPWSDLMSLVSKGQVSLFGIYTDDKLVGFLTMWPLPGFKYIEHLAIDQEYRNSGIGFKAVKQLLRSKTGDLPVVLEVDRPESSDFAPRRIEFYRRCGFELCNDIDYVQPPYEEGLPSVPMYLMIANAPCDVARMQRCQQLILYLVYKSRPEMYINVS